MFIDIFILAFKNLLKNKLRSSLSILWVVIWVFTIVLVLSIGKWVENMINEQLKFLNITSIFVEPSDTVTAKSKLDGEDIYDVLNKSKNISGASIMALGKWNVIWNNKKEVFNVIGTSESFLDLMSFDLLYWEYFTRKDVDFNSKIAVVWDSIIEKNFNGNYNVIWQNIFLKNSKFKIIGIIGNTPSMYGFSFDDAVYIPFTTSEKFVLGKTSIMALIFLAKDIDTVSEAWRDIKRLLREKHKLWENDVDDFNIYESKGMIQAVNVITKALSFLIIWVAWIILIVSWIGIMNVMFAGVAEKTKDIWISRAIGAKKKDILLQFLLESIILTLFWGLIWVFLAESLIMTVNIFSDVQLIRSNGWDIFALSFALVIWVFFGIYPAKKATKLDVVESLK